MNHKLIIGVIIIIVVFLTAFGVVFYNRATLPKSETPAPMSKEDIESRAVAKGLAVKLFELNNSGISGNAYLVGTVGRTKDNLKVILDLEGVLESMGQLPAHIHYGNCENIGEVLYPLESPFSGYSETEFSMSLNELLDQSPTLSINIHKSDKEPQIFVACGNLKGTLPF